jgi:uncharacterized protein DUF3352
MFRYLTRTKVILSLFVIFLIAVGFWIYAHRVQPVAIASYVPQSALAYLEINDWPRMVDRLTSSGAWKQLAPAYGIDGKLSYIGKAGWLANLTGVGETAILARTQFAIVLSGLEVRGEEVRPRLALIAETHAGAGELRKLIDRRLPELARKVYGRELKESSEYGGVQVTSFAGGNPGRRIYSAQIEGGVILANHPETLRACIDTRLGRAPSMASNIYLANARPIVRPDSDLFGFITGEGVTRLLGFGAFMLSNNALRSAGITDVLDEVLSELSSRTSDGIAYGASFEKGEVVDRYSILFKPELVEGLRSVIKVNRNEPQSLNFIPAGVSDVTIFNVENPDKTLDGIEAAVSARIGVGHSFLLHQFLLGARGALLGVIPNGPRGPSVSLQSAIGNEIASISLTREPQDRIWLITIRDRQQFVQIVERYLGSSGGAITRENYAGCEIINSNDAKKGAAALLGDFIALGRRPRLIQLIDALQNEQNLKAAVQSTSTSPAGLGAVIGFSSAKGESGEMMAVLSRWLGGRENPQATKPALDRLPFASSTTTLNDLGFYTESHSPFGNFPYLVSLFESATSEIK